MQTLVAILLLAIALILFWAWQTHKISNDTLNAFAAILTVIAGIAAILLFVIPAASLPPFSTDTGTPETEVAKASPESPVISTETTQPSSAPTIMVTLPTLAESTTSPSTCEPSTPEESALIDYLEAIEQKEYKLAAELVSRYSVDFFSYDSQSLTSYLEQVIPEGVRIVSCRFAETRPLDNPEFQAVRIRVELTTQKANNPEQNYAQWFTLLQEGQQWRVNAATLVDYIYLDVKPIANQNVVVQPLAVVRLEDEIGIRFTINNTNSSRAVLLDREGFGQGVCIVRFPTKEPMQRACYLSVLPETEELHFFVLIEGFQSEYEYPIAFELYGWELSEENSLTSTDIRIEPWSYQFELKYAP